MKRFLHRLWTGLRRQYSVDIEEDSPALLTLHQWPVTLHFDSRRRQFWRHRSTHLQSFATVRHVEMASYVSWWQNRLPIWIIRLHLVNGTAMKVGISTDDVASLHRGGSPG